MARHKVYILDGMFPSHERELAVLSEVGADVEVLRESRPDAELIEACRDANALMLNRPFHVSGELIRGLPGLKIISGYGIGTDGIDIPAATERKIPVANLPGFCAEDVSEQAIMLLLAASRKLIQQNNKVKSREVGWTQAPFQPIYRLTGKVLGLVGLGSIGKATARKAQGLGMSVLCYDPYVPPTVVKELNVELVGLEELFRRADHISIHVGVTPETTGMVNAKLLRLMKPTSTLVNTSRGKIVNQDDLVMALREGWIGAAGLDVVREDPPSEETYSTLIALPNVVITPHSAWYTEESVGILQRDCARNVALVLSGQRPMNTVNKEIYK
jgi:D-3-phosphoglycerate dehydrogenase / 2-oxoglutarate reductase